GVYSLSTRRPIKVAATGPGDDFRFQNASSYREWRFVADLKPADPAAAGANAAVGPAGSTQAAPGAAMPGAAATSAGTPAGAARPGAAAQPAPAPGPTARRVAPSAAPASQIMWNTDENGPPPPQWPNGQTP